MVSQILSRTDQDKFPFEKQFGTNKFSIDIVGKVDFKEAVLFRNFLEISEVLKVGGETDCPAFASCYLRGRRAIAGAQS